jgi:hypothetical protein
VKAFWTNCNGHYSAKGKVLFLGKSRARVQLIEQGNRPDYTPGREIVVQYSLSPYNRIEVWRVAAGESPNALLGSDGPDVEAVEVFRKWTGAGKIGEQL